MTLEEAERKIELWRLLYEHIAYFIEDYIANPRPAYLCYRVGQLYSNKLISQMEFYYLRFTINNHIRGSSTYEIYINRRSSISVDRYSSHPDAIRMINFLRLKFIEFQIAQLEATL